MWKGLENLIWCVGLEIALEVLPCETIRDMWLLRKECVERGASLPLPASTRQDV
jgi:hypothetical protein